MSSKSVALAVSAALASATALGQEMSYTQCQQIGSSIYCNSQDYGKSDSGTRTAVTEALTRPMAPNILGSFDRGRESARKAERHELELEFLRQRANSPPDLPRLSAQMSLDEASKYYDQQIRACERIAVREQPAEKVVDAIEACRDKLLVTDARFAEAYRITQPHRAAAAEAFIEALNQQHKNK